jgi:hypothetical protein
MLRYFGPRYFRAYYFTPNGGGAEQASAILANRRFMSNMGSMMGMGGM